MALPDDKEFDELKADANKLFQQGNYRGAVDGYSSCLKINPDNTACYTNRALCRLRLDLNKKAEEDCSEALKRDPQNVKAYYRRAAAKKATRNYRGSIDDLRRLLEIEPSNKPATNELNIFEAIFVQKSKADGDNEFKKRNYGKAAEYYSLWISVMEPCMEALAFTNRALCYLELNEFKKAEEDCGHVIREIDPENEDAYYRRMLARKGQSDYSGSEEDWNRLHTLVEDNQFQRKVYAMKLEGIEPLEPAILREIIEQSVQQEKYHKLYFDGGDLVQKGNFEEARDCYTICLEMYPNHPDTLIKRAQCLVKLDQNEDAERDCTDALESEPNNADAFFCRAIARKGLENFTGSKGDLEELVKLNRHYDEARVELDEVKDLIIYFEKIAKSQGSRCSLCNTDATKDAPSHNSQLDDVSTCNGIVRVGKKEMSFEEATVSYIDTYFSQWRTRTYRVPPGHFHDNPVEDHKVPRDLKPDRKSGKKKGKHDKTSSRAGDSKARNPSDIKTERDGSNAVETIVQLLNEWGNIAGEQQPMFILKDYEFRHYLKNVVGLDLEVEKGDHDILVIHQRFGILAIQVKCSEKEKELSKAYKQVCKDERIFKQVNIDLGFAGGIKFTKAIAMTEMNERSKFVNLLCSKHRPMVLTKANQNLNDLTKCLTRIGFIQTQANHVLTPQQYQLLVGRYVGLASVVPLRTLSEATEVARGRLESLQLNPEQLNVLQSEDNLLLIQGASGTGKTFLLVLKAKMLARQRKSQVYIILLSSINEITGPFDRKESYYLGNKCSHVGLRNHLKYLIEMDDDVPNNLHVTCEHEIRQRSDDFPKKKCLEKYVEHLLGLFSEDSLSGDQTVFDFFFDEVPRTFLDAEHVSRLHLFKYSEFFYSGTKGPSGKQTMKGGGLRTLWIAKTADQPCLQKLDKAYTPFTVKTIGRCVRLTKANFAFVKAIVSNYVSTESKMPLISGCRLLVDYFPGNAIHGVKPLYASVDKCSIHEECDEDKLPDNPEVYANDCLASRLKKTMTSIFERLAPIESSVQILVNEDFFGLFKGPKRSYIKEFVGDCCAELGCTVTGVYVATYPETDREREFENVEVNVTNYEPFVGCECDTLIAVVDNYSLVMSQPINLLGMLSRVMGQLVILRLPQNGPKSLALEKPFERACNTHTLKM